MGLSKNTISYTLHIMVSNGGVTTVDGACKKPITTLLSGPVAGVIATLALMKTLGIKRAISFDMGGTSTDVSLIDGVPTVTKEKRLGGVPIPFSMIEIESVGQGGGSIAHLDELGILKVGPESQGANPGPACYGFGGKLPTLTDANLIVGRLDPQRFFGGRIKLDVNLAKEAVGKIAKRIGFSIFETAESIIRIANSGMEKAIRVISIERGVDTGEFSIVAFGGAGPQHACTVEKALGIKDVIVPFAPAVFCALGMLMADKGQVS
jgi:N-methylhydantoinase A